LARVRQLGVDSPRARQDHITRAPGIVNSSPSRVESPHGAATRAGSRRVTARTRLRDEMTERVLALPGVELRRSRFGGGDAFFVGAREFAHFHRGNVIDVRLTRRLILRRKADLAKD